MATSTMNDSWRRVQKQILALWGDEELPEAELKKARGNLGRMVDLIHEKTGEPRPQIIQKISSFI